MYPSCDGDDDEKDSSEQSIESGHAGFTNVNNAVTSRFKELMKDGCGKDDIRSDSLIAGSMANALCCILFSESYITKRWFEWLFYVGTRWFQACLTLDYLVIYYTVNDKMIVSVQEEV